MAGVGPSQMGSWMQREARAEEAGLGATQNLLMLGVKSSTL